MFVSFEGKTITHVSTDRPTSGQFLEVVGANDSSELLNHFEIRRGALIDKRLPLDLKTTRVAMVSSYGINCGIATYAQYLCDEMRAQVGELQIFAEHDSEALPEDDERDNVVRCWERAEQNYDGILKAVTDYQPDVVYVQHEYGCFNHGPRWNILIGHLSEMFRTIVVLHSVYDQADKLIFESPCKEIITHSKSGRELLKSRGITHAKIHYVPHGCSDKKQLDVKYATKGRGFTIFQYGFGFEYKGWDNVIEIMDKLTKKVSVNYVGVFNISKFSEDFGKSYYSRLMKKIRDRGLQCNVVLLDGFRDERVLLSYMTQSQVNLFPYWNHPDWRVHGASGAIRLALASGTPTVVGDVPFFDELKGYIPVCKNTDDYVETLNRLLTDAEYRENVLAKTSQFIEERTWAKIADWYLDCLNSKEEFTAL